MTLTIELTPEQYEVLKPVFKDAVGSNYPLELRRFLLKVHTESNQWALKLGDLYTALYNTHSPNAHVAAFFMELEDILLDHDYGVFQENPVSYSVAHLDDVLPF